MKIIKRKTIGKFLLASFLSNGEWEITNRKKEVLGYCFFNKRRNKWCYMNCDVPDWDNVYDAVCLNDIRVFLVQLENEE